LLCIVSQRTLRTAGRRSQTYTPTLVIKPIFNKTYDGVIQSPQLASDLQYLEGKRFIDSENEGLYEVTEIFYNPEFNVIVGKRKPLDGRLKKLMIVNFVSWR
jgi:hypothetical protein